MGAGCWVLGAGCWVLFDGQAMTTFADDAIGNFTKAMEEKKMWDDTVRIDYHAMRDNHILLTIRTGVRQGRPASEWMMELKLLAHTCCCCCC